MFFVKGVGFAALHPPYSYYSYSYYSYSNRAHEKAAG